MKRISRGLLALALTCLLGGLSARIGSAKVVDQIVAEVNDEVITMSELQRASKSIEDQEGISPKGKEGKDIERQMLEGLIDKKLAKAEAKRRGIKIEDKEVDAALENFKKRNHLPDEESLNKALANAGLTLTELRQNITDQLTRSASWLWRWASRPWSVKRRCARFTTKNIRQAAPNFICASSRWRCRRTPAKPSNKR